MNSMTNFISLIANKGTNKIAQIIRMIVQIPASGMSSDLHNNQAMSTTAVSKNV